MSSENKISVDVELAIAQAQKDIEKISQQFTLFGANASSSIGKVDSAIKVFQGTLAANALLKAVKLAGDAISGLFNIIVTDGVKAAMEQEDALNQLNTALVSTGIYSDRVAKDLSDFADALQNTTKYSDEQILSNMALLQSLGRLDAEGLKRATSAAVNLSAALKIDLETATKLVAKAAAGNTEIFKRYGIELGNTGTEAQKFARLLELVEKRFGTAAQDQLKTYSGQVAHMGHMWGEVQESLGGLIIKNPAVISLLKSASEWLERINKNLKENAFEWTNVINIGLFGFVMAVEAVLLSMDILYRSLAILGNSLGYVMNMAGAAGDALQLNFKGAGRWMSAASQSLIDIGKNITGKTIFAVLADEAKKAQKEMLAALATGGGKAPAGGGGAAAPLEDPNAALLAEEEAKRQTFLDTFLFQSNIENAKRALLDASLAYERATADKQVALKREVIKAENALMKAKVDGTKTALNTIATLQTSHVKELFYIGKAAAIGTATVNTFQGISEAWKLGPVLGPILAPLVAIAGAIQIANITAQQPGFATGGIVGGTSYTGDTVPVRVNSREGIFTLEQQQELFDIANGNRGGGGGGDTYNFYDTVVDSPARVDQLISKLNQRVRSGTPLLATRTA